MIPHFSQAICCKARKHRPCGVPAPKSILEIFQYVCGLFGTLTPHSWHFPAFRDDLCEKCGVITVSFFPHRLSLALPFAQLFPTFHPDRKNPFFYTFFSLKIVHLLFPLIPIGWSLFFLLLLYFLLSGGLT